MNPAAYPAECVYSCNVYVCVCVSERAGGESSLDSRTQASVVTRNKEERGHSMEIKTGKYYISPLLFTSTSHQSKLVQHFSPTWLQFAPAHAHKHAETKTSSNWWSDELELFESQGTASTSEVETEVDWTVKTTRKNKSVWSKDQTKTPSKASLEYLT